MLTVNESTLSVNLSNSCQLKNKHLKQTMLDKFFYVNSEHLIVKPSLKAKSAIWKYFGFPMDDTGMITDQKNTIC